MKEVKIYTWIFCPYCIKAKRLLKKEKINFEEINIFNDKAKLEELKSITNSDSVPQIFVDGEYIGGCDELYKLYDEKKFDKILKN